jgi:hypothetical protein
MKLMDSALRIPMAGALLVCHAAFAHGPVFDCYIKSDGRVACEAGFTDGSSAVGRQIHVQDPSNKVLLQGEIDKDNTYTFQPPAENYSVVFLGGAGHEITIQSSDISR